MQAVQREAWATVTSEAYLVDKGQAGRPAAAETGAELARAPAGAGSAAAVLVRPFGGSLLWGYG